MAWKNRGGKDYFYASRRVDGLAVKEYFGRGPDAEVAADAAGDLADLRARIVALAAGEQTRLAAAREASWDLDVECRARLTEVLGALGYHRQNSGPWRKRRRRPRPAARRPWQSSGELRLVPVVDEPTAVAAVAAWAAVYARGEPALAEATACAAVEVRDALATIVDPPVFRFVAAWSSVAWLEVQWAEVVEAEVASGEDPSRLGAARRTAAAARARLARVLAELGTVGRLIAAANSSSSKVPQRRMRTPSPPGRREVRSRNPVTVTLAIGSIPTPRGPGRGRPDPPSGRGSPPPATGGEAGGPPAADTLEEPRAASRATNGRPRGGERDQDDHDAEADHE